MTVEYPGHLLRTRRQALLQSLLLMLVLLPLLASRIGQESPSVAVALGALTVAPFAIAYRAWRFLELQERRHREPTAEMLFAFEMLAVVPLALAGMMMVLMTTM